LGRTYVPLCTTLSEKEAGVYLIHAESKIGKAETLTRLPFSENELGEKLAHFALIAEGKATLGESELKKFGQELYRALFSGDVKDLLEKTKVAAGYTDGLRIDLNVQSRKLGRIPWELLHDGTDFLALSRRTPIVRRIPRSESERPSQPNAIELPLSILFAGAKPTGQTPLNLGRQIRQICMALRPAMLENAATIHPALGDEVQPDKFLATIRTGGHHVLHISTHGTFSEELDRGFILLEDGTGNAVPLAINALATMMRDTAIQLVYLDACETAAGSSLSESLLRSGVNAAVAMQFPIRDDLATRFSEAFYRYLMAGEPLWYAVTEARIFLQDLLGRETIDWAIPVLHVQDGYTPSIIGTKGPPHRYSTARPPARFVGREPQLDELTEKLLQPSTRSVIVHGFGGIGKSRLVEKLLSEIDLLFQDTCYFDCRGIGDILATIPKIDSMLSLHGFPLLDERLRGLDDSRKIECLMEQLDKARFLVVLDNIDDMQDNPTTAHFIGLVDRLSNAKLMATCRIPSALLGHQRQLRLEALEERHAIALIREIGRDIPQIRDATDFDLRRVNEKLRGHPLSIVIAVPYFEGEPFESVLKDLPSRVGSDAEIARKILAWSYSKLSLEERGFLENASVFYGQVPMEALLDINDGKSRDVLASLVKNNMIEFSSEYKLYSLHPTLREYAYAKLCDRKQENEVQIKAAEDIAPRLDWLGYTNSAWIQLEG
jgi:hypothetical protein